MSDLIDELVIRFYDDVPASVIDLILDNYQADRVHTIAAIGWHKLKVAPEDCDRIMGELRADPAVQYVFRNDRTYAASVGPITPNDTFWSNQWQLRAMDAPRAWAITTGSRNTKICVADQGAQPTHEDFQDELGSRILTGLNTYDDPPTTNTLATSSSQDHGVKVTGVIAATGNNGKGVAGVNWKCLIYPVKISNYLANGYSTPYSTALGIMAGGDATAQYTNLSWGLGDVDTVGGTAQFYQDAVDYALGLDCVTVIISGNRGNGVNTGYNIYTNQDQMRRCLIVGAAGQDGHRLTYSNFGTWVTMVAPVGGDEHAYAYRTIIPGDGVPTTILTASGKYALGFNGTSAAVPLVVGAGSLADAVTRMSAYQRMALLKASVNKFDARWHDEFFSGYGQISAYKAVSIAQLALPGASPRPTVIMATPQHNCSAYVGVNSTVSFEALVFDEVPVDSVSLYVDGSATPYQTVTAEPYICTWEASTAGIHTFQFKATSASGVGSSESRLLTVLPAVSAAPFVGIISHRAGDIVSGTIDVAAATSVFSTLAQDANNIYYPSPYIDTFRLCLKQNGVEVASLPQVTTGGVWGQLTIPANVSGAVTLEATAVASNGLTTTQSIELNVVAPAPLKFVVQPSVLEAADDSVIIGYGTADTSADDAATSASALASVTDRLTIREAASAIVTAGVSVTDARQMVEAVTATAQSAVSVTATVTQVEQLLAQIDAFPTVADIMTIAGQIAGVPFIFTSQPTLSMSTGDGGIVAYGTADTGADDVSSAATATAQISEVVQSLEGLVATVAAIPSVADMLSQLETVASAAQAQASVVDEAVKGIAEDLATTATALADVADLQLMVDNLTVMAESGASLEELAAYTDAVTSAAVIQDSVADVLRSRDAIRYFLASTCSPRNFADTASPRIFSSQCSPGRA